MAASLGVSWRNELWNVHQLVRTLAEDSVRIRYKQTAIEDIEDFPCTEVTAMFSVNQ
jgi:hypothetical protein